MFIKFVITAEQRVAYSLHNSLKKKILVERRGNIADLIVKLITMPCLPFLSATQSLCPLICSPCIWKKSILPGLREEERERGREREAQREGERERERASVAGQGVMCSITIPIEPAGC